MVITGLGCLLPGVSSSEELWQGLRSGACHITPLDDPSMRCLAPPWFGRIDPKRDQMAQAQVPHRLARNASVQTGWGMAAAAQAMAMAGLPCGPASPGELLAGSGRLGLYTAQGEHLMQDLQAIDRALARSGGGPGAGPEDPFDPRRFVIESLQRRAMNPFTVIRNLSNNLLAILSMSHGIRGDCGAFGLADGAGIAALQAGTQAIAWGDCEVALVVATGSIRQVFTLVDQFHRSQMAPAGGEAAALRPFDRDRQGMVSGEGAVALVIERADSATLRGATPIARIGVPCSRVDSAVDDEAYRHCLEAALATSAASATALHGVFASGLGWIEDVSEVRLIERALSAFVQVSGGVVGVGSAPAITTATGLTGHISAVSELVSVVAAALALHHQELPPVANLRHPLSSSLTILDHALPMPLQTLACFSRGEFAHHACTLLTHAN
jgi:3-oxoacyl-[acyl-carrier-protein] synthase II